MTRLESIIKTVCSLCIIIPIFVIGWVTGCVIIGWNAGFNYALYNQDRGKSDKLA